LAWPDFTRDLMAYLDLSTFNYYCLNGMLQVTRQNRSTEDVRLMELGAPSRKIWRVASASRNFLPYGIGDDLGLTAIG
jgi:hypothetical protein